MSIEFSLFCMRIMLNFGFRERSRFFEFFCLGKNRFNRFEFRRLEFRFKCVNR